MPLTVGARLGPYEVVSAIGAGGMGEVYRARDTKLNRDVAIKVLPESFASDAERLARFTREAQTLASLNHPNIAQIFGFEDEERLRPHRAEDEQIRGEVSASARAGGGAPAPVEKNEHVRFLVMELVEGVDLSQKIEGLRATGGGLAIEDALPIAKQIAEALEAAHEQGIVHRDLKPANVKVRLDGTVKVLDFGLAKAMDAQPEGRAYGAPSSASMSPTLSLHGTMAGMILGTAAYMSPEQASGKPVDKRADVWSFGVVLFEMLTGQRLFEGETISHTLADVLRGPIDFNRLPADTPRGIRELLRRCLNRDVKKRLRDMGEARIAIEESLSGAAQEPSAASAPVTPVPQKRSVLPWVAGALLATSAVLAVALGIALRVPRGSATPVDRPLMRLDVSLGADAIPGANASIAISPDGTRIVFPIRDTDGKPLLATRLLDQAAITRLPGTENGTDVFFSPDGQSIGFVANDKLKTIALRGGTPVVLSDVIQFRGASWGESGDIVANLRALGGLLSIPSAGGAPLTVTNLGPEEVVHLGPQVLPGGRAVLFTATRTTGSFQDASIQVVSLGPFAKATAGKPESTGEVKTLLNGYGARYVATSATSGSTGHLVFLRDAVLYAVAFDPVRLEVRGTPQQILGDVAVPTGAGWSPFDVSRDGTFVYHQGLSIDETWPILWLDSTGKTEPLVSTPSKYSYPSFSPDGQRLALTVETDKGFDVFVYDRQRDAMSRLTFTGAQNRAPVWSRDGAHLLYTSYDAAGGHLHWIRADGSGETQVLLETRNRITSPSLSPDGKLLAYHDNKPDGDTDVWLLPLDTSDPEHPRAGKPVPFLQTPAIEAAPVFSPDGRYIAYMTNESGKSEIYVRPAPAPDGKVGPGRWQVTTDNGMYPTWSPNGRELFYRRLSDSRIMVTDYTAASGSFSSSKVRVWSDRQLRNVGSYLTFALAPDGKRFAMFPMPETTAEDKGAAHVTFLLNFFDELRRKVPVDR